MYINNNSKPVSGAYQTANTELQKANENAAIKEKSQVKTDVVDISFNNEKAKDDLISKVSKNIIKEAEVENVTDDIELSKIEALKTQIKNNEYPIDAGAIVKKMLSLED